MTTVFIAGSMNIRKLDPKVQERIDNIVESGFDVIVGDADGADASVQEYLVRRGAERATVFCSGGAPRNNVGHWPVRPVETSSAPGSRAFFTAKDVLMADVADFGLMIWDAKSTGTLSNVIELLSRQKKCVVFVNKERTFKNVSNVPELEALLLSMSDNAKQKADDKIGLYARLDRLRHVQTEMFA